MAAPLTDEGGLTCHDMRIISLRPAQATIQDRKMRHWPDPEGERTKTVLAARACEKPFLCRPNPERQ